LPKTLEPLLGSHRFFAGLDPAYLTLLAGCAKNVVLPAGAFVFTEGASADRFYLIRDGVLALEVAAPGRSPIVVQTLRAGDVAGFSWLVDPRHRWQADGRVVERVRALEMDGTCMRGRCEADPRLGYELMRRFAGLATALLEATRLQLLDVYGHALP